MKKCKLCNKRKVTDDENNHGACFTCKIYLDVCNMMILSLQKTAYDKKINRKITICLEEFEDNDQARLIDSILENPVKILNKVTKNKA